jgi:hypothetical protein
MPHSSLQHIRVRHGLGPGGAVAVAVADGGDGGGGGASLPFLLLLKTLWSKTLVALVRGIGSPAVFAGGGASPFATLVRTSSEPHHHHETKSNRLSNSHTSILPVARWNAAAHHHAKARGRLERVVGGGRAPVSPPSPRPIRTPTSCQPGAPTRGRLATASARQVGTRTTTACPELRPAPTDVGEGGWDGPRDGGARLD